MNMIFRGKPGKGKTITAGLSNELANALSSAKVVSYEDPFQKYEFDPLEGEILIQINSGPSQQELEAVYEASEYDSDARLKSAFMTESGPVTFFVNGQYLRSIDPDYPTGCGFFEIPSDNWKMTGRCNYSGQEYYLVAKYNTSTRQGQVLVTHRHPDLRQDEIYDKHGGRPIIFGMWIFTSLVLAQIAKRLAHKHVEPIIFIDEMENLPKKPENAGDNT